MKGMEQKHSSTRTNTTQFLLPLLGLQKDEIMDSDFISSFSCFGGDPEEGSHVFIVYSKHQPHLVNIASFWGKWHVDESRPGVYFYRIDISTKVTKLFWQGKYSKFPIACKKKILAFWDASNSSKLYSILYPTDYIYEAHGLIVEIGDIWPKPDVNTETLIHNI